MTIESEKITVNKSANELFTFLTDVKNFEQLLPENTSKFEVLNSESFLFALKGMPEIGLKIKETETPNKIVLGAISGKLPHFTLTTIIDEVTATNSAAKITFNGDFNAMMGLMIKNPITNFVNTLAEKMRAL